MLIILEGPDGGGKSTLVRKAQEAKRLRSYPQLGVVSQLGGRTMSGEQMRKNTYSLVNGLKNGLLSDKTVLCERLHAISDEVYRGLFGGTPFLTLFERTELYDLLGRRTDVRIVYCRPPVQAAIDRGLAKAGDDTEEWLEEVAQKIRPLYDLYDDTMNRLAWEHGLSVIRYDFTSPGASKVEGTICAA